jgi:hypothetical protein
MSADPPAQDSDEDNGWLYEDEDDYDERDCFHCGGDGLVECHDPIQCTRPHNRYGECPCASCGGSGLAKDMTIW